MGQSTDAYLYYGFSLEEGEFEEIIEQDTGEELDDYECWIIEKVGGPKRPDYIEGDPDGIFDSFLDEKINFEKTLTVFVSSHCSCDYPIYFVYIKESFFSAYRGYPVVFTPDLPKTNPEWIEQIKQFCEKTGIPYRDPRWELSSMWC